MLNCYYAIAYDLHADSRILLDLGSIDIKDEDPPKIDDYDIVPIAQLNYIREKALTFLDNIERILNSRQASLPED